MFLENFEKLCKDKGVSPTGALLEMGMSNATYSNWKKRGSTPQGKNLQKIADYFGVSASFLLAGEANGTASPEVSTLTEKLQTLSTLPGGADQIAELTKSVDDMLARLTAVQDKLARMEALKKELKQMEQELTQDNSANAKK